MRKFTPVTDEELALARRNPMARHRLLAANLDLLLAELNKLQRLNPSDPARRGQIKEGVDLAVKLANLIHRVSQTPPSAPKAIA